MINPSILDRLAAHLEESSVLSCSSIKRLKNPYSGHPKLEIQPSNPDAASIGVMVTEEIVVLFFGRGAVLEVPERGGRYTKFDLWGEIWALISAVMRGAFEETVFFHNDEVVGARARIFVTPDDIAHETWKKLSLKSLFGGRVEKHFSYAPYKAADDSTQSLGVKSL